MTMAQDVINQNAFSESGTSPGLYQIFPPTTHCVVYALVDPRCRDVVRYVGQSINPESRLRAHLREYGKYGRCVEFSAVRDWSLCLQAEGIQPEMWVIEECDRSQLDSREQYWIEKYRGVELLNGIGNNCVKSGTTK
jgi:hypothetical protein